MKTIGRAFIYALSAATIISCASTPDNLAVKVSGKKTITIGASLAQPRTQLGENSGGVYSLYWSEGDKISINGVASEEAVIDSDNPSYASFKVSGVTTDSYCIAYPPAPEGKVLFAENQTYTSNTSFEKGAATMYGFGTSNGVQLNHISAILKIGIFGYNKTLTRATITTVDTPIAGEFNIDFKSGAITSTANSKQVIYYSFGDGVKLSTVNPIFLHIALPAREYTSINVTLYDNDGGSMTKVVKLQNAGPIAGVVELENKIFYSSQREEIAIGKTLPAWSEGELDIHFINSGRGECCFYIMPDGTTLLIDAGETTTSRTVGKESVEQRPSASVRPYITYVNYIKHFLPYGRNYIDYCVPSHFHIDHVGQAKCATEVSPEGIPLTGLLAVYYEIPFHHIFDNTYPDYIVVDEEETPEEEATEDEEITTSAIATRALDLSQPISYYWGKFVKWGVKNNKFTAARFTPGEYQIEMLYAPEKYPYFEIFNICANGFVWGVENGVSKLRGEVQSGNAGSCGIHLIYNEFDYIACGDLVSRAQNLVALYVRDLLNRGANEYHNFFDAFKAHHHLAGNSWGTQMARATTHFTPRFVIDHCFNAHKPHPDVLPLIVDQEWSEGFFATNIHPNITAAYPDHVDKITDYGGHIVMRVAADGKFNIYMLDDSDFEYRIKSIHGPYEAY